MMNNNWQCWFIGGETTVIMAFASEQYQRALIALFKAS